MFFASQYFFLWNWPIFSKELPVFKSQSLPLGSTSRAPAARMWTSWWPGVISLQRWARPGAQGGWNGKPWENHRKNTRNPGKTVIQARKIGISMRFMADSGDSWLIHDSEVGENGVADYSHFIGTWWLTIIFLGYPMSRHIHFLGGKRPTLRGNMSIYHEPNAKPFFVCQLMTYRSWLSWIKYRSQCVLDGQTTLFLPCYPCYQLTYLPRGPNMHSHTVHPEDCWVFMYIDTYTHYMVVLHISPCFLVLSWDKLPMIMEYHDMSRFVV